MVPYHGSFLKVDEAKETNYHLLILVELCWWSCWFPPAPLLQLHLCSQLAFMFLLQPLVYGCKVYGHVYIVLSFISKTLAVKDSWYRGIIVVMLICTFATYYSPHFISLSSSSSSSLNMESTCFSFNVLSIVYKLLRIFSHVLL